MRTTIKRSLVFILIFALCLSVFSVGALAAQPGMDNFTEKNEYYEGLFTDIAGGWFEGSVARGYSLGLINGKGNGVYEPYANVTLAEAIKLAACIHSIYNTGEANFNQGSPWYQVYVNYCFTKGILQSGYPDYNAYATRAQFAQIFASALPPAALPAINTVDDNAIPDVKISDSYGPAVYKLYRAGILTGNDAQGTFKPASNILRSEMAAIVTRMADMNLRKEVTLTNGAATGPMNAEQIAAKCSSSVFYIEVYDAYGNAFASGSGVFISADGKALTNHHVVEGAHSAAIMTSDGNVYKVKGYYDAIEAIDLAMIQIEGSSFPYLEMADVSTIAAGQTVFAIGSPLGLDNTISQGIISNPYRVVGGLGYIQTTAPISHGSSGGALINDKGQLIGITSAGFDDGQNLNLAVPINRAAELYCGELRAFPVGSGGSTNPGNPGTTTGASLSFNNSLSLTVGQTGTVHVEADSGDFDGYYYLSSSIGNTSVVSTSWSSWNGSGIDLYVTGLASGSTTVTITMYTSDGDVYMTSGVLNVTVSGGGGNSGAGYYSGHYPAPDFGYYTGCPLYYQEQGVYFYRYVDMDVDWALNYYAQALYNQGFEFWKETTDSYGDPVLYYVNRDMDLYVYIAINYIDGYTCLEICPYFGYEVP